MAAHYKVRTCIPAHEKDVRAVTAALFPDGAILSGSRDVTAKLWVPNESDQGFHEGHVMSGHSNFISSVCFMPPTDTYPQGLIVTGSNDFSILAFTLDSPVAVYKLTGHKNTVCSLAAGKFGTLLSGSWDKTAKVWLNEKNVMTLEGHEAAVWGVAIMPEQGLMLTASADRTIKMWKAGRCVQTFTGHDDCVRGIAVLNAGEFLSCSNDGTVRHWATTGDCLHVYYGHENFVYSISILPNGQDFVTSSEDRTVRVWKGGKCVQTIPHPTMSVWTVCTLQNGDVVSGASDGIIRVFTTSPERMAPPEEQKAYEDSVAQAEVPTQVGDINVDDLPGPESLLNPGKKDGQTKMVKNSDGKVELYHWDSGESQWKKIGDVVGSSGGTQQSSGKMLHDGKEYDYVFSVDIEEGKPPLKLPYNTTEDPWFAAQRFLDQNELSQMFLDQVAEFIMKNAKGIQIEQSSAQYADPFTGGGRYVPGSVGEGTGSTAGTDPFTGQGRYVPNYSDSGSNQMDVSDPFTGQGRYVPGGGAGTQNGIPGNVPVTITGVDKYKARKAGNNPYFPLKSYVTFDAANPAQIIGKLKEFNTKVTAMCQVDESSIDQLQGLMKDQKVEPNLLVLLQKILCWPKDMVFPVLDVLRICIKHQDVCQYFCEKSEFLDERLQYLSGDNSAPNQMLTLRTLCNLFNQPSGEKLMCKNRDRIITTALNLKGSANKNIQIAIATLLMNYSVQLQDQSDIEGRSQCLIAAANLLENNLDLEAGFRLLVCIGTLISSDEGTRELAKSLELKNFIIPLKGNTEPKKLPECASFVIDLLQIK